jgi:hypothetical protein
MTPKKILLTHFRNQSAIADVAGCSRQAISIAFRRGRLSYQVAALLAKKMRIPVALLLVEWIPETNRIGRQSRSAKRRMNAVAKQLSGSSR